MIINVYGNQASNEMAVMDVLAKSRHGKACSLKWKVSKYLVWPTRLCQKFGKLQSKVIEDRKVRSKQQSQAGDQVQT